MVNGTFRVAAAAAAVIRDGAGAGAAVVRSAAGNSGVGAGASAADAADRCITAAHPMYDAIILPCDAGDARQQWSYNATTGRLTSDVQYTAAQPACLASSFVHGSPLHTYNFALEDDIGSCVLL
jgi:hypothetical protein